MPDSPHASLEEIKHKARAFMETHGAKGLTIEEQNVAFGLKALILKSTIPEEKGTDIVEIGLAEIPHVSSVTVEDYRRAFG
jgi:translation elongation factor aEF-1 beta